MSKTDTFRLKVERQLRSRKELFTIITVLQKVQRIVSNPESSSDDLARMIGSDAVLTAKVLKLVNSAYFGLARRISSIDEAIVILGYNQLKTLCAGMLSASMMTLKSRCKGYNAVGLWKHSLGTAAAAALVQTRFIPADEIDLFTAGLLCNIGRAIMAQRFAEQFSKALKLTRKEKISLIDAELNVFGVTHAEVGFWAAEIWRFDETLAHTIRHHHGPIGSICLPPSFGQFPA